MVRQVVGATQRLEREDHVDAEIPVGGVDRLR